MPDLKSLTREFFLEEALLEAMVVGKEDNIYLIFESLEIMNSLPEFDRM